MAEYVVGPVDEFPPGTHRVVKLGRIEVGVFNVNGDLLRPTECLSPSVWSTLRGDGQRHDGLLRGDELEVRVGA